jgi:hypothetical protein
MDPSDDEPKMIPCPDCGGTGKIPAKLDNLPGPTPFLEIDCPTCNALDSSASRIADSVCSPFGSVRFVYAPPPAASTVSS